MASMSASERPRIDGAPERPLSEATAHDVVARLKDLTAGEAALAFPDDALQALQAALVHIHGARFDAGIPARHAPDADPMVATAVLVTATNLLKAANLEIFELGMWQSWSGTKNAE